MSIFAISDLHLAFVVDKPMDRFGPEWVGHPEKIAKAWKESVRDTDTVLVCGDTSWAMRPEQAAPDLEFVGSLPGRKVLLRGNHDYWWGSLAKVRRLLPPSIVPLHNDSHEVEGWWVCGSRGWSHPGEETTAEDHTIFERELGRLRRSLESVTGAGRRLAMLHYPPYPLETGESPVLDLLVEKRVEICVYGHLHAVPPGSYPEGEYRGITFHCVSVDLVQFTPRRIVP